MPYKDPEQHRANSRAYYEAHKEQVRKYKQQYHEQNKARLHEERKAYRKEHADEIAESKRQDYNTNKDAILERQRAYYKVHSHKRREYARTKRNNHPLIVLATQIKLSVGCQNPGCKWNGEFDASQLEFHHVDPKTKAFNIGSRAIQHSEEELLVEISKCCVLCSNCHQLVTFKKLDASGFPCCKVNDDGTLD